MVKKLLFIFAASAYSVMCMAQPVLTGANNNPVAGDMFINYSSSTRSNNLSAGSGITWDYSALNNISADTLAYVSCDSTTFTGSNIASSLKHLTSYTYFYYHTNNDSFAETRQASIIWNNPRVLFTYPFTYNNTFTDSFAYYSLANEAATKGSDTVSADGYGTLKVPGGATYPNVLRVHTRETRWDSVWSSSGPGGPVSVSKADAYNWYLPGYHNPVVTVSFLSDSDALGITLDTMVQFSITYVPAIVTVLDKEARYLNIYPNPAGQELNVGFVTGEYEHARIYLLDVTGRIEAIVADGSFNSGEHSIAYNTSALSKGIYFLRFEGERGVVVRKVILSP